MKWSKKRFTFVIIPDANGSVKRVSLSVALVVLIPALFIFLVLAVVSLAILYRGNAGSVDSLQHKLADSSTRYEKILADKNDSIESLQTQVAGLSEKAKSIQEKIEEVNRLETQVKDMVGLHSSSDAPGGTSAVKAAGSTAVGGTVVDGDPSDGGMGGEELPVTDEEIAAIMSETRSDLMSMEPAVEELKSRLEQTKLEVAKAQKALRKTPTIWPTDNRKITSLFGVRKDPFTGRARFHAGIDISGSVGDSIYAAADGIVIHAGRDSAEGNNIIVDHGNGIRTRYMHLSKLIAEVGDKVSKGDVIGELGSTGRSTGPHLHYEVLRGDEQIDPAPYLQASRKVSE